MKKPRREIGGAAVIVECLEWSRLRRSVGLRILIEGAQLCGAGNAADVQKGVRLYHQGTIARVVDPVNQLIMVSGQCELAPSPRTAEVGWDRDHHLKRW